MLVVVIDSLIIVMRMQCKMRKTQMQMSMTLIHPYHDEYFCESDYEAKDDDAMFDKNVDAGVEFSGLEDHSLPHDYEYAVEGLINGDGDSDVVSYDELRSQL
ncbi:hypothetical protein RHMOL_Rhmol10G0001200 [Rhododendron molle]|uniref:Uncharacterized protein n=1 Tax=Rhododendron molle TaxID=49168 RepID=A0ACC0LXH8_RHOML|nr:hypothetical protein RHMOL_Rhmol10G0001200 [Rhododendron molle]